MNTLDETTNKDPINYLTEEEKVIMGDQADKMSIAQIIELRAQIQILKNKYRTNAAKEKPVSVSIYENATVTKIDILNTKKSVTGVNNIAKKAAAEGNKEGKAILEKFAQNFYGDKLIRDSVGLNPIASIKRYDEFEKAKPLSVRQAETTAQNEEQFKRLQDRIGTETPDPNNKPIYNTDEGYLSNFKDKEAVLQLLKSCIPCEFRKLDFSAEFTLPWSNTLDDLKKKWKDLLRMLKDLSTFRPGEFSLDLCDLFKFLDGQCIPDIAGMLSLLSMMQLKYTDLGTFSLENIINQLIAPFLTPIIGSFTSNLDQYSDLILAPLKCVTRALEKQLIALQDQANGVAGFGIDENFNIRGNIADQNTIKYRQKEIEFIDTKIKALRNRKLQLERDKKARLVRESGGSAADVNLDGDVLTPNLYPAYAAGTVADTTREQRIVQTKLVAGGIRLSGARSTNGEEPFQLSISSEIEKINSDIDNEQARKNKFRKELDERTSYKPANFNGAISLTRQSEFAIQNFEKSFKSIIGDLTEAINDGIGIVKQSIDIYREEFQRLVLGRITTQQDQIEFTRLLQKIARLKSIVGAINDLKSKEVGWSIKRLCERGSDNALAQLAKGMKENDSNNMFDFYGAVDGEGNPLILIAPGGAKVSVTSIDFDDLGDDALFADSSFDLDSVTKTVSFNDLNEVDKMNRDGIIPNLGNIDSKKIELSNNLRVGSELDLHFKTSYAIISNEFCSKSAISFGSSDTVKQWAASLWQKE
jgi:hypothetical protein